MNLQKSVTNTIAAMRAERGPLAARLDAIDLAIENLSRVYGLHGSPQPAPLKAVRAVRRAPRQTRAPSDGGAASARRDEILTIIGRAAVGSTAADIRKQTPKMDSKARSNALSILKATGRIKRAGNTWVKAA